MAAQKPRKKPRARRSPNNALVLRLTSKQTDDVSLLPKRQQAALIKLAKRQKHMRVRALLSGAGKTSAAQFLARKLDLELYRIDLGAVVSKYMREIEKELDRLFNEAEDSGAMLFIDEADALFSKHSEVKDAHDRYANILGDYLRKRIAFRVDNSGYPSPRAFFDFAKTTVPVVVPASYGPIGELTSTKVPLEIRKERGSHCQLELAEFRESFLR
jgi:ATPase family associated with various cellular activities (AAA)